MTEQLQLDPTEPMRQALLAAASAMDHWRPVVEQRPELEALVLTLMDRGVTPEAAVLAMQADAQATRRVGKRPRPMRPDPLARLAATIEVARSIAGDTAPTFAGRLVDLAAGSAAGQEQPPTFLDRYHQRLQQDRTQQLEVIQGVLDRMDAAERAALHRIVAVAVDGYLRSRATASAAAGQLVDELRMQLAMTTTEDWPPAMLCMVELMHERGTAGVRLPMATEARTPKPAAGWPWSAAS